MCDLQQFFSRSEKCPIASKFLHALENDQELLAYTSPGTAVPHNFLEDTCRHYNVCATFVGHCPLKIWEGKNVENLA